MPPGLRIPIPGVPSGERRSPPWSHAGPTAQPPGMAALQDNPALESGGLIGRGATKADPPPEQKPGRWMALDMSAGAVKFLRLTDTK